MGTGGARFTRHTGKACFRLSISKGLCGSILVLSLVNLKISRNLKQ